MDAYKNIEEYSFFPFGPDKDVQMEPLRKDLRTCVDYLYQYRSDQRATEVFLQFLKTAANERQEEYPLFPHIENEWSVLSMALGHILSEEYSFGHALHILENDNNLLKALYGEKPPYSNSLISYAIEFDIDDISAGCKSSSHKERREYFAEWLEKSHAIDTFPEEEKKFGVKRKVETYLTYQVLDEQLKEALSENTLHSTLDSSPIYDQQYQTDEIPYNFWLGQLHAERAKAFTSHPKTYKSTPLYDVYKNTQYFERNLIAWLDEYASNRNRLLSDSYESNESRLKKLFTDYMTRVYDAFNGNFFPIQFIAYKWVTSTTNIIKNTLVHFMGEKEQSVVYLALIMCLKAHSLYEEYVEDFKLPYWKRCDIVLYNFWGQDYIKNLNELQAHGVSRYEAPLLSDYSYNKREFPREFNTKLDSITEQYKKSSDVQSGIQDLFNWLEGLLTDYIDRLKLDTSRTSFDVNMSVNHWMNVTQAVVFSELNFRVYSYLDSQERYHDSDPLRKDSYSSLREFFTNLCTKAMEQADLLYTKALDLVRDYVKEEAERLAVENDSTPDGGRKLFSLIGYTEDDIKSVYVHMKSCKMFDGKANMSEADFVSDFMAGDLKEICKRPRISACKYLINFFRSKFEEGWMEAVASSLEKSTDELEQFRNSGYNFNNNFERLFPLK